MDPRGLPRCAERSELPAHFEQAELLERGIDAAFVRPVARFLADHPRVAPHAASLRSIDFVTLAEPTPYPSVWARERDGRSMIELDAQYILAHRAAVELALVEMGWFPEATGYRDLVLREYAQKLSGDRLCRRPPSAPSFLSSGSEGSNPRGDDGSFDDVFESAVTEITQCYIAYIVAHEIAHVELRHTGGSTVQKEREADAWALQVYADAGLPRLALLAVLEAEAELEAIRESFGFRPAPSHPTWAERSRMARSVRSTPAASACVRVRGRMVRPPERGVVRGRFIDLRLPADLDELQDSTVEWTDGTGAPVDGIARRDGRSALLQFRVEDDVYSMTVSSFDVTGYVHWSRRDLGTGREIDRGLFRAVVYRSETFDAMMWQHGSACLTSIARERRALSQIGATEDQRAAADAAILQAHADARSILREYIEGRRGYDSMSRARGQVVSKRNDALRRILGERGLEAFLQEYLGEISPTTFERKQHPGAR